MYRLNKSYTITTCRHSEISSLLYVFYEVRGTDWLAYNPIIIRAAAYRYHCCWQLDFCF